eukprot:g2121.t1
MHNGRSYVSRDRATQMTESAHRGCRWWWHILLLLLFINLSWNVSSKTYEEHTCSDASSIQEDLSSRGATALAEESCAMLLRLRPIGHGVFGSFMSRVASENVNMKVLPAFTRSSGLEWEHDVLGNTNDAVYVCTPDNLHARQAISCLEAGKHVLVEKPVYDFQKVRAAAEKSAKTLMVGFHRRHDVEYKKARRFLAQNRPKEVLFESYDPVPRDSDLANVVCNSVIHDIDLVHWLFPRAKADFGDIRGDPSNSQVTIEMKMVEEDGHVVDAKILYHKMNPSYVQRVTIDGTAFGYDFQPPNGITWPNEWAISGPGMAAVWKDAYAAQFGEFVRMAMLDGNGSVPSERRELYEGYERTFAAMRVVASVFEAKSP